MAPHLALASFDRLNRRGQRKSRPVHVRPDGEVSVPLANPTSVARSACRAQLPSRVRLVLARSNGSHLRLQRLTRPLRVWFQRTAKRLVVVVSLAAALSKNLW